VAFSEGVPVCIQAPFSRCETDGWFLNQNIRDDLERKCEFTRTCTLHAPRSSQKELWGVERESNSDINELCRRKPDRFCWCADFTSVVAVCAERNVIESCCICNLEDTSIHTK
jgi:hypothetical protein